MPGNAPAPNFDPTKSNSVVMSSAGQIGRGGNIMIDGADNNDDVVGGPLQNVTQESVQEFQIATNRYTAESGRSASSVINVVTKSGTDQLRGSAALFLRDSAWQGLPATFDRSSGDALPFDRQQIAGSAGGPIVPGQAFWFGAAEYRNQDGAVLVGTRDVPSRTITRGFAPAPLDDFLFSGRLDWRPHRSRQHRLPLRRASRRPIPAPAPSIARSARPRSGRSSENSYNSVVGTWTRVVTPDAPERPDRLVQHLRQRDRAGRGGPQLTFPSIQDGTSFRVPQGTTQNALPARRQRRRWSAASHTVRAGGEWQRDRRALRSRRLPGRPPRDGRGLRRPSTTTATAASTTTTCCSR